jgi:hypothetical protein
MNVITMLRQYYGQYRLTLSGYIAISSNDRSRLYEMTQEQQQALDVVIRKMQAVYPFIDVKIKNGVHEKNITFFSDNMGLDDRDFLEHFQQWLVQMTETIRQDKRAVVSINCDGDFTVGRQIKGFRYLNKGLDIKYKVTSTSELSLYKVIMRSRWLRIIETVILAAALIWYVGSSIYDAAYGQQVGQLL